VHVKHREVRLGGVAVAGNREKSGGWCDSGLVGRLPWSLRN
jgi:hypothetical protein